jgi:hypothetical protein
MLVLIEDKFGGDWEVASNKAVMLFNMGRCAEAIEFMRVVCEQAVSAQYIHTLATMLLSKRRITEASQVIREGVARFPEHRPFPGLMRYVNALMKRPVERLEAQHFGHIFFTADVDGSFADDWGHGRQEFTALDNARPLLVVGSLIECGQLFCLIIDSMCDRWHECTASRPFQVMNMLVNNGELVNPDQPVLEVVFMDKDARRE